MENYTICNCKKVTYADVEKALHDSVRMEDVETLFKMALPAVADAIRKFWMLFRKL